MSLASLLPLGGTAVGLLAPRLLRQLPQHLPFASLLQTAESSPATGSSPSSPTAAEVKSARSQLPGFLDRLKQVLDEAGISWGGGFTLQMNSSGELQVDGEHPERARIEDLLGQTPELAAEFRQIESAATAWRSRYGSADGRLGNFQLVVSADDAQIRFA